MQIGSAQYLSRWMVLLIAAVLYGVVAVLSITTGLRHFELLVLGLQIVLLLPALVYVLYPKKKQELEIYSWKDSSGCWKQSKGLWICLLGFVLCALLISYPVSQGITFADESSYRFQARVFAGLKAVGDAPPGSPLNPVDTPLPLAYKHLILSRSGWFSKYPLGWPAALALPEKVNLGWAAAPCFGGMLLLLLGGIAREAFGASTVLPAVWIAVLSPYCLAQCVGRMSHAFCAVLIAGACWFCLRGIRTLNLGQFTLMFVLLALSFHVRPFTAFIVSAVLGVMTLWYCRRNRRLLAQVALLATGFALLIVFSVLLYNRAYTGSPWLSPYALYDGQTVPKDISATPALILENLFWTRRFSAQSTLLYAFPFVFALAAYGFWVARRSPAARVLVCLFPAIFIAHLAQTFSSSPIVGERYYFEAYFSVVILAAYGTQSLVSKWRTSKHSLIAAIVMLTSAQVAMSAAAVRQFASVGQPYREVTRVAEQYRNCRCAVFLKSSGDLFSSAYMNLNTPAWKSDAVFYLNDPGQDQRARWAGLFGWSRWVVVGYDVRSKTAHVELDQLRDERPAQVADH